MFSITGSQKDVCNLMPLDLGTSSPPLASPKLREKVLNVVDDIWYLRVGLSDYHKTDLKKVKELLKTKRKSANMISP